MSKDTELYTISGSKKTLRTIFDQTPQDYDAVRPGYPEELIEDLLALSAIPEGGRVLEIGCGTGQATLPFARRGYAIHCLDIGKELAAIAARKCQQYPRVTFEITPFEEWTAEENAFDLVMSATAFHWIPPEIGYPKAARVLNDRGSVAIFSNGHPTPYTGFFESTQQIYEKIVPEWDDPADAPPIEARIQSGEARINSTGLFEPVQVRTYAWMKTFTTADYIRLLNTFSGHRNLEERRRTRLFSEIADLIEKEFGGSVDRPYLSVLYVARKKSD